MTDGRVLKIRVSLRGRPIKSYVFSNETIKVGRNPDCEVFLDNPGISREHLKFERSPQGTYTLEDLNSANGVFLNDEQVQRELIKNEDVVRIGKFSLWMTYEDERRTNALAAPQLGPAAYEGTTVLKTSELEDMITTSRESEPEAPSTENAGFAGAAVASEPARRFSMLAMAMGAFVIGYAAAVLQFWYFWNL
jgi:predicted component of type VI protein secretion system